MTLIASLWLWGWSCGEREEKNAGPKEGDNSQTIVINGECWEGDCKKPCEEPTKNKDCPEPEPKTETPEPQCVCSCVSDVDEDGGELIERETYCFPEVTPASTFPPDTVPVPVPIPLPRVDEDGNTNNNSNSNTNNNKTVIVIKNCPSCPQVTRNSVYSCSCRCLTGNKWKEVETTKK